jgi:hypothetical protein
VSNAEEEKWVEQNRRRRKVNRIAGRVGQSKRKGSNQNKKKAMSEQIIRTIGEETSF